MREVELVAGGAEVLVTSSNVEAYVALAARRRLLGPCAAVMSTRLPVAVAEIAPTVEASPVATSSAASKTTAEKSKDEKEKGSQPSATAAEMAPSSSPPAPGSVKDLVDHYESMKAIEPPPLTKNEAAAAAVAEAAGTTATSPSAEAAGGEAATERSARLLAKATEEKTAARLKAKTSVKESIMPLAELAAGLRDVVKPPLLLTLLSPTELCQAVCGPLVVDVKAWRKGVVLGRGFTSTHPTVLMVRSRSLFCKRRRGGRETYSSARV
jgi:hypothetical protein